MSTISVVETIAGRVEREFERVRAARPALSSHVSRAEGIIVAHLSCRRQRVIRVRVRDGRARFLVSGSESAVYVIDPADWSCSCPDHHRRGKGCKHALACWALWRASARPAQGVEGFGHGGEIFGRAVPMTRRCDGCGDRFAERDLIAVGPEQAEWTLTAFEDDELCRPCAIRHGVL